ncbi:MAG: tetratricopeptide repeat protein [Schleiferiaceae bacterium]|nr:tetratricopeptide repeat protein [Schleiferiaceae bacterium]
MQKGVIVVLLGGILLGGALYMAPRWPSEDNARLEEEINRETSATTLDEKVAEATRIISEGSRPPMEAIGLLREVVEEDPNHLMANYRLGEFSVMSGQYEKGIERFEKVLEIDPLNSGAIRYLAISFNETGATDKAIAVIENYLQENPNSPVLDEITQLKAYILENPGGAE